MKRSDGQIFPTLGGKLILVATTVAGDSVCRSTNLVYRLEYCFGAQLPRELRRLP